jgi:hypothetical protein
MSISNENDQKLRRLLAGSSTTATTYRDQALIGLALEGGRFANHEAVVTGVGGPAVNYPMQSTTSPWSQPNLVEPPLGWSVEDQEPCGEYFEVQQSLEELARASTPAASTGGDATATSSDIPAPVSDRGTGPISATAEVGPTIQRKRRFA